MKREYTGTWIPKYIMEDDDLTVIEKIIYAEIASFDDNCFMKNETLAERYKVSEITIKRSIKVLKDKNYIFQVSFDGRNRILGAYRDKPMLRQTGQNDTAEVSKRYEQTGQNDTSHYIDNNIDNNIERIAENKSFPILKVKRVFGGKKEYTPANDDQKIRSVISLFSEKIDPRNSENYGNTTQRKACDFLITNYGFEEVKDRITIIPELKKKVVLPNITTPLELKNNWKKMENAYERHMIINKKKEREVN